MAEKGGCDDEAAEGPLRRGSGRRADGLRGHTTEAADLKCAIPFAFSVNDRALPAGIYDVTIEQGVLTVKGYNDGAYVLVNRLESTTNRSSKLVFHKLGDDYVLFQAWSGASDATLRAPGASRGAAMSRRTSSASRSRCCSARPGDGDPVAAARGQWSPRLPPVLPSAGMGAAASACSR